MSYFYIEIINNHKPYLKIFNHEKVFTNSFLFVKSISINVKIIVRVIQEANP